MSVLLLIYLAAFVVCLASAWGKVPTWVAVLLLCIAGLLSCLPLK
jgi:hypothetical protein